MSSNIAQFLMHCVMHILTGLQAQLSWSRQSIPMNEVEVIVKVKKENKQSEYFEVLIVKCPCSGILPVNAHTE